MSLPPGFLDELRNRLSLAQVVGRKVSWDMRKSNQGKGDMWAPCPFHQEKSASFHVDDKKGYYYCFGCHEKGDAISFAIGELRHDICQACDVRLWHDCPTFPQPHPDAERTSSADRTERQD